MEVNKEEVSRRIKLTRLKLGLTMEEFGERLNTSKGAVNNWEKGINLPSKERLKKIAEFGNTSVHSLMYGSLSRYIEKILSKSKEYSGNHLDMLSSIVPLIKYNNWTDSNPPSEEEVIKAYKNYEKRILEKEIKNQLQLGVSINEAEKLLENYFNTPSLPENKRIEILRELEIYLNEYIPDAYYKLYGESPSEAVDTLKLYENLED